MHRLRTLHGLVTEAAAEQGLQLDADFLLRTFCLKPTLLARQAVAMGPTAEVLTAANRLRARQMAEAWDEAAAPCRPDQAA